MKLQSLVLAFCAVGFLFGPPLSRTAFAQADQPRYSARLLSPTPGEILKPGQIVRVQWTAKFPDVNLSMCETEVLLPLDGGKTIYMMLTEQRNPTIQYFDWTVPNTPTEQAVLDIRFGCLNIYPETAS